MSADVDILYKLSKSSKTRQELIASLPYSQSTIDRMLRILCQTQQITYEIVDNRKKKPLGRGALALESNPKVRVYSLVEKGVKQIQEKD